MAGRLKRLTTVLPATGDRRLPSEADAAQRFGDVHGLSGFVACSAVELTLGG